MSYLSLKQNLFGLDHHLGVILHKSQLIYTAPKEEPDIHFFLLS